MSATNKELVTELESFLKANPNLEKIREEKLKQIIDSAARGQYHDFESDLATPKVQLVQDLHEVGLPELADRVKSGEFDE